MKYRVSGSNKDTGARMTLEFEARSKADAERKAQLSGMVVNRVEVEGGVVEKRKVHTMRPRVRGRMIQLLIVLAIAAAALYWLHQHGVLAAWRR